MTLTRWIKREKEVKLEEVKNKIRKPRKIYLDKLIEYINENPDAYLSEIAQEFNCTHVSVLKALRKLGITRKKDNFIQRTMPN